MTGYIRIPFCFCTAWPAHASRQYRSWSCVSTQSGAKPEVL